MPNFQPDVVTFGDIVGYGSWDVAHHREHLQFVQVLAQQVPPVSIPDFDFLALLTAAAARKSQVQSHQAAHVLLRQYTNVQGIDLGDVDLDNHGAFDDWIGYHRSEHDQIRQALGIT